MPYFQLSDGVKIYYERFGSGRPIVFIHPPLMGHVVFTYQRKLTEKYEVIFYDCRGHGQSTHIKPNNSIGTIQTHIDDLKKLIDYLEIKAPIIVGYSNGGVLALSYALKYRDNIAALILSGGYPKVESWLLARIYNFGILLMQFKMKNLLSSFLAKSHKVTDEDQENLYTYGMRADTETVKDLYIAGRRFDVVNKLHELNDLPILVIYGTKEFYISMHKKYFAPLQKTEIVFIDGGKHQLPMRWYHAFNSIVLQFLSEQNLR